MKKKPPIENKIYASIIGLCEEKEANSMYRGNGHHLAQDLSVKVAEGLLPKQQRKIYDAMSKTPQTCKEIGAKCNFDSKIISAQLKQIHDGTLLIGFKTKGRIKLWYRYHYIEIKNTNPKFKQADVIGSVCELHEWDGTDIPNLCDCGEGEGGCKQHKRLTKSD